MRQTETKLVGTSQGVHGQWLFVNLNLCVGVCVCVCESIGVQVLYFRQCEIFLAKSRECKRQVRNCYIEDICHRCYDNGKAEQEAVAWDTATGVVRSASVCQCCVWQHRFHIWANTMYISRLWEKWKLGFVCLALHNFAQANATDNALCSVVNINQFSFGSPVFSWKSEKTKTRLLYWRWLAAFNVIADFWGFCIYPSNLGSSCSPEIFWCLFFDVVCFEFINAPTFRKTLGVQKEIGVRRPPPTRNQMQLMCCGTEDSRWRPAVLLRECDHGMNMIVGWSIDWLIVFLNI